jgi:hypothetical protein
MADPLPPSNPDPTPEELAQKRLPAPLPPSEREVYEGKLKEVREENEKLAAENKKLKELPPETKKKKGFLSRYNPLD